MNPINKGEAMKIISSGLIAGALSMLFVAFPASAQDSSIFTQCPTATDRHPDTDGDDTTREAGIKCDHLVAGDGLATMADGYPQYIFSYARVPLPGELTDPTDKKSERAPSEASGEYPGWVMAKGLMAANIPAPTIVVDEDDELFLSLTNVGMAQRPDLFDPHTIHWHGFPQAASVFDGVPDSSISINMGATLTYYYSANDAGTYMYHCHVEATEHMQMGMLGNLWVRPRQNRLAAGDSLYDSFVGVGNFADVDVDPTDGDWPSADPLVLDIDVNADGIFDGPNAANADVGGTTAPPAINTNVAHVANATYAYNDGDGSTRYDVDFPIQIGSFDAEFHDASFNTQPLPFAGMKDTYFMLNGRGYPDTVNPAALSTINDFSGAQVSQPVHSLITATPGQRILLRISNLAITDFYTLGTNGLDMQVVGRDARLLRDDSGNNMDYETNSLTLGGGQSVDVILDTRGPDGLPGTLDDVQGTFFLYSKNLHRLSNNNENFGGMMTEIRITP